MNDLQITKKCAEANGFSHRPLDFSVAENIRDHCVEVKLGRWVLYDPLHDDAQAMALVKKLRLQIETIEVNHWVVSTMEHCSRHGDMFVGDGQDLNRAICECVAKMQSSKSDVSVGGELNAMHK